MKILTPSTFGMYSSRRRDRAVILLWVENLKLAVANVCAVVNVSWRRSLKN